ncbi:UNVERIFIED_CONTAM: hypothetical protein K2H54_060233 [Gekko kuhli]
MTLPVTPSICPVVSNFLLGGGEFFAQGASHYMSVWRYAHSFLPPRTDQLTATSVLQSCRVHSWNTVPCPTQCLPCDPMQPPFHQQAHNYYGAQGEKSRLNLGALEEMLGGRAPWAPH